MTFACAESRFVLSMGGPNSRWSGDPALTTTMLEHRMADSPLAEEWRPVPGHPKYEVSSLGRVRNLNWHGTGATRVLPQYLQRGYPFANLTVGGKSKRIKVSRLVCEAWHGPPPSLAHHAAHNDGTRDNNAPSNLRWATAKENVGDDRRLHGTGPQGERNPYAKLTVEMVRKIRSSKEGPKALGARLGVSKSTISAVRSGQNWAHVR